MVPQRAKSTKTNRSLDRVRQPLLRHETSAHTLFFEMLYRWLDLNRNQSTTPLASLYRQADSYHQLGPSGVFLGDS